MKLPWNVRNYYPFAARVRQQFFKEEAKIVEQILEDGQRRDYRARYDDSNQERILRPGYNIMRISRMTSTTIVTTEKITVFYVKARE